MTISIDTDTVTPGIQSVRTVTQGDNFDVDVYVTGIPAPGTNAFEFDVDYDSTKLTANSVASGGFLLPVVIEIQNLITATDVNFAEQSIAFAGVLGDGVLATINLTAFGVGMTTLDLNDVVLSVFAFGFPPPPFDVTLFDGIITIEASGNGNVNPIPEPGSMLLLGSGLVGLVGWRWRQGRQ